MSNDAPLRSGFPPRRDAPEPAVPLLRMKSDLSRTHLVTARISGKLHGRVTPQRFDALIAEKRS